MKRIISYNVIEGDPNEIDSNEIWFKRDYNTGQIDLQKRDALGELKSIVINTSIIANPDKGLTPVASGDEFDSAYEALLALATEEGASVPLSEQVSKEIGVLADYLPLQADSTQIGTNKINVSGYLTSGGLYVSTGNTILKVSGLSSEAQNVVLTKVEI